MTVENIEVAFEEASRRSTLGMISSFVFGRTSPIIDEEEDDEELALNGDKVVSPLVRKFSTWSTGSLASYDTFDTDCPRIIRFQVVVWYVGRPDEVLGKVEMKFRVTIFWNSNDEEKDDEQGYGMNNPYNKRVWKMHGRQRAYRTELSEVAANDRIVYVPPVSILNAVDHEVLGEPEVCQVNTEENMMKWSCLYKASLLQDNMKVAAFPHDSHNLVIRLGVIKHRQRRKRWDKNKWQLGLATKDDTQETIKTPHGIILDHVKVPGFSYGNEELKFQFLPLDFGSSTSSGNGVKGINHNRDQCLEVRLPVTRESSYYDRNIIPLLAALNTIGICVLALKPSEFGARGECLLAIAFVEIGIRMTVDSKLPVVGYQIKIQWVLNNYFFGLLVLVAESSVVYLLQGHGHHDDARRVDIFAAIFEFIHMLSVLLVYSIGSENLADKLCLGFFRQQLRYG